MTKGKLEKLALGIGCSMHPVFQAGIVPWSHAVHTKLEQLTTAKNSIREPQVCWWPTHAPGYL